MSALKSIPGAAFAAWLSGVFTLAIPLSAQQPAAVGGIVVDAGSGQPIPGVEVRVEDPELLTVTDQDGVFRLTAIPRGRRSFVFRHIAYGEHQRSLVLEAGDTLQFEVTMSQEAIELSPLVVEVARSYADEVFLRGGNPANIIDARTIEAASRTGLSFMSLLRQQVPGIRLRGGNCIEYRFQAGGSAIGAPDDPAEPENVTCRELAVYMDGVRVQESASLLYNMYLDQLERVEVLSPGQAGVRYGQAGAQGVILLETKQGLAPEFNPDRVKLTGFDWYDEQPYRWTRVLGVSFAANAAAAAATFGVIMDCGEEDPVFGEASSCNSTFAAAAGVMTGTLAGLLTSWAGKSPSTEGRIFPLMLVGAASATTSYLLLTDSEMGAFDGGDLPGLLLASAATSVMTTLTDRIFRITR